MAAEDELALPQVPEAKPEDTEDISWALSTAEAMWARGDHVEGIKWVRKAAEAASEIENDERALELAKAASELANLIARRSMVSASEMHGHAAPPAAHGPSPASAHPASAQPGSVPPQTARMPGSPSLPPSMAAPPVPSQPRPAPSPAPPAAVAPPAPPTAPAPIGARPPAMAKPGSAVRSVPPGPIPLPSRASVAPKAMGATAAPAAPAARAAPRPLATSDARQGPQAGRGILTNRTTPEPPKAGKGKRKSRENMDEEARAAGVLETAPQTAIDGATAERTLSSDTAEVAAVEMPVSNARVRRRSRPEPDPTVVTSVKDLIEREKSAEEWDASPTENLTGGEMDSFDTADRKTTVGAMPVAAAVAPQPYVSPSRAPSPTVHDPEIQTSQAVRVVVWRDANGVHVAPAGTIVSSITIDAVLVVLEPGVDLTAWLSHRDR